MLKQVAVIGLSGLVLAASPASADETSAIAGTVASGVAGTLICTAAAIYSNDDEADPDAYDRQGWFIGGKAGYALEQFDSGFDTKLASDGFTEGALGLAGEKTKSIDFDDSYGLSGHIGYRCHSRFSVEVQVEWVNGFDADVDKPSARIGTTNVEPVVVTTNAKAYILTGQTQPFIRFGLGIMTAGYKERDKTVVLPPAANPNSYRENRFALRVGGGVDHYLTKNLVVSADVDFVAAPNLDIGYVIIGGGLQYRF